MKLNNNKVQRIYNTLAKGFANPTHGSTVQSKPTKNSETYSGV